MHLNQYAANTITTYCYWIGEYLSYFESRDPRRLCEDDIEEYLTHLAEYEKVAASTQNQAFNAILFLYRKVLKVELNDEIDSLRAKPRVRVPVVLSPDEACRILEYLKGKSKLIVKLILGSGLRVSECINLRIKDVDFDRFRIAVRSSKSKIDRETILPKPIFKELLDQRDIVIRLHEKEREEGNGSVFLPPGIHRKYRGAHLSLLWQYFFPSKELFKNPNSGLMGRGFFNPDNVNRSIRNASAKSKIFKRITSHTFRHTFATQLLESGCDIRTIQTIFGHKSISTTMVYTHVASNCYANVRSPLEWIIEKDDLSNQSLEVTQLADASSAPQL